MTGHLTWLTDFVDLWTLAHLPDPFNFGRAAQLLRPIVLDLGQDETVARFARYLDLTPPSEVSLYRFSQRHQSFIPPPYTMPLDGGSHAERV